MRLPGRAGSAVFLLHVVAALLWRTAGGVRMEDGRPWEWFWQTLPLAELRADLLGSVGSLHSQPPLLNLWGGLLAAVFPGDVSAPLQLSWILLGGLAAAAACGLLRRLTGSPGFALAGGALLALHPGFFVYEAYPLYTLPAAALALLAAAAVARHGETGGDRRLLAFLVALSALVLLRSAFHLVILAAALPAAVLLARRRVRTALLGLLVCLPPAAWYAKNAVEHGFFGGSSWAGQGLWRVAASGRSREELRALAAEGVVDPDVAEHPAFSPPAAFAARFGPPDRNDLHADTVPAISRLYGESAMRLVRREPVRYLGTAWRAFRAYTLPSTRFKHVRLFADRMGSWEGLYAGALTAGGAGFGGRASLYLVLLPAAPLVWLACLLALARGSLRGLLRLLRADAAAAVGFALVVYAALAGSLFEFGENERFKFMTEPLFLTLLLALVHRCATGFRRLATPPAG